MTRCKRTGFLRRNGHVLVTLRVSEDDFAFATRFAEQQEYFGADDFLQSILTPELWRYREQAEGASADPRQRPDPHGEDEDLRVVEDDGGHASLAGGRADLDDDIPF